ncbi:MAG: hypothetical protein ACRCWF_02210 [Beijerinckiaceae bacterium]
MIAAIRKSLSRTSNLAVAAAFALAGFGATALPGAAVVAAGLGASIAMSEPAFAGKTIPGIGIGVRKENCPTCGRRTVKKQPPRRTGPAARR